MQVTDYRLHCAKCLEDAPEVGLVAKFENTHPRQSFITPLHRDRTSPRFEA